MSRTYVLQAPRIALAAARMKADVNFLGAIDRETAKWLENNHVFLRDVWEDGEVTVIRLQRLYHRLFPGNFLFMDASLPEALTVKAAQYAKERGARVIICLSEGREASTMLCSHTDILICKGGTAVEGKPGQLLSLDAGENPEAWAGAMALCMMNDISADRSLAFCQRAAAFGDLPWYDEVAYEIL